jgi:hypothetical protein
VQSLLEALARRARRRHLANSLLAALAPALAAALGAFLLVLLVGSALLDWRLCLIVFAGVLGWKLWPLRRLPTLYRVAQRLDRTLGFPDTLSTAWFFSRATGRRASEAMKEALQQLAEERSRTVDVRHAVPIEAPRAFRSAVLLAVAAAALLGVRFSRYGTLDLEPPVARVMLAFFGLPEQRASAALPAAPPLLPASFFEQGLKLDEDPLQADGTRSAAALPGTDVPEVNNETAVPYRSKDTPEPAAPAEESSEAMENGAGDTDSRTADPSADSKSPPERTPQPRAAPRSPEDSGLLARLRDAMADLLNRLKIQPDFGETRAASERGRTASDRQQPGPGQKAAGQHHPARGETAAAEEAFQPQTGEEMARGGQGQSGDRTGEQPAPGKDRSGIGKEEGSKELREAEQLAAMGKISELIGRRAQNVSGEVTVEVLSSRQQQLKTPYTDKRAAHADTGGQIHRDEVPLIYQDYVQRYFEEVHKSVPAPR